VATEGTSEQTTAEPAADLALLRAAADGDGRAFHDLVGRHSDSLFRLAVTLCRSRADAEDVLQETLIGAYRGLAKFDGRASVKTWLTQILLRQSAKMWNKGRRMSQAGRIDSPAGAATGESLARPSAEDDVDRRADLMAAIDALPDDHREVILLREVRGLSYDEIARVLRVPHGTVESRLHRARAGLRQRLKGYPP
jgi:RNA polymerase sigma-70 factor (ECF subfamily)